MENKGYSILEKRKFGGKGKLGEEGRVYENLSSSLMKICLGFLVHYSTPLRAFPAVGFGGGLGGFGVKTRFQQWRQARARWWDPAKRAGPSSSQGWLLLTSL
ncbi:unnamed protein product [Prunus armeniaca]